MQNRQVYQVDFYDPNYPAVDQYLVYVHIDRSVKRGYSSEADFATAASRIAEKLINIDFSSKPAMSNNFRFYPNLITVDVDSFKGKPNDIGAGITLWLERAPEWSQLQNPVLLQIQITRMRSEVEAQRPK
jgi:hypothetical protein